MNPENVTEETPKVNPFLARTIARKRAEVSAARRELDEVEWRARAADAPPARPWVDTLSGPGVGVIAEIKRRSPSAGALAESVDAGARARLYEQSGAAAVSVLTDAAFDGSLDDLSAATSAVSIPVLRKDFVLDPYEVWRSRAAGADALLVIVSIVDEAELNAISSAADDAAIGLLVEVHTERDLERISGRRFPVVGVNSRNLETLEVSATQGLEGVRRARERLDPATRIVAESGVTAAADVVRARDAGANAVLVGEHLMRASAPDAELRHLVDAGLA